MHLQEVAMRKTIWTPTLAWLGAVTLAGMFALATPTESHFLGYLPSPAAQRIDQQRVVLPHGLTAERTLALVGFQRSHRSEIESWVKGLGLDRDSSITWVKMPVLNDPGSDGARTELEAKLLAMHHSELQIDTSRLVPIFTNRDAFVRAAGLSGMEHAWVLVLDRDGKVLARAEGKFDAAKAEALRETLQSRGD
jgi:hypothetical protein